MISPRKNIRNLLLAFRKLNPDYYLVIGGGKGWSNREEYRLIEQTKNAMHIGKVRDEDMAAVYSLATAFVFPSLYEGFGLPAAEAMACGCPVIASDAGSYPEVVGDAGMLVSPVDTEGITQAMLHMTGNPKFRSVCVRKGLVRAKSFRWNTFARAVVAAIERVGRNGG